MSLCGVLQVYTDTALGPTVLPAWTWWSLGVFTLNSLLVSLVASCLVQLVPVEPPKPQSGFVDLGGKSHLVVVRIPHGTFQMGTNQVLTGNYDWTNEAERPAHSVSITKDFWMGQYPVTQGQWHDVMGNNPSFFQQAGPDAPVEQVTWIDVQAFLSKANALQSRWIIRLPTEAEWEYAAIAGTTGDTYGPLDQIAWYAGNSSRTIHPVGQKQPNAFGLYDMLGNVWQWCQDWFAPYTSAPAIDPQGPPSGERRNTRGGCYYCEAIHERAARRNRDLIDHSSRSIGFRIVATPRGSSSQ